jgi:hypothetical protein
MSHDNCVKRIPYSATSEVLGQIRCPRLKDRTCDNVVPGQWYRASRGEGGVTDESNRAFIIEEIKSRLNWGIISYIQLEIFFLTGTYKGGKKVSM